MIFGEKYFSGYILSTDQISLSHCLYFLTYCAICALQLFVSQFTRLKFEINYSFLIKAFSYMTKKVRTNIYRYQEQKQLLRWNKTGHLNKTWNKTATFTTELCLSFQIFLSRFVLSTSFFILKISSTLAFFTKHVESVTSFWNLSVMREIMDYIYQLKYFSVIIFSFNSHLRNSAEHRFAAYQYHVICLHFKL